MRYKCILAYNGQNYHGWAMQPGQITIQSLIQDAIKRVFNQKVKVIGSGRTDAGVNALGQVIHFDLKKIQVNTKQIMKALNKVLPYDVKLLSVKETDKEFNARFSAKNKTYRYILNVGKNNPIESSHIYQYNQKVDVKKLREISNLFIGQKNFLSFSTDARDGESVIKKVNKINISKKDNIITININGDGFLRSQVRMMVGTMLAYEQGKMSKQQILDCFANPKKGACMYKAPACGLCLVKVYY